MISGYRGLARSIIERFYKEDARLSILARKENAANELRQEFPNALITTGDVASADITTLWTNRTVERFGQIDALINNAAILGPVGKWADLETKQIEETLAINLVAPIRLIQQVVPIMLKKNPAGGVIINLSGGGATGPRPHFSSYSISKIALVRLTENLSLEYPALRFYAVAPGLMKTQLVGQVLAGDPAVLGKEYNEAQRCMEAGANEPTKAVDLIRWLIHEHPAHLSGAVISAIHDKYQDPEAAEVTPGWWRLRRVDEVLCRALKQQN